MHIVKCSKVTCPFAFKFQQIILGSGVVCGGSGKLERRQNRTRSRRPFEEIRGVSALKTFKDVKIEKNSPIAEIPDKQ